MELSDCGKSLDLPTLHMTNRIINVDIAMVIVHRAGTLAIFGDGDLDKQCEAIKRFMDFCKACDVG